MSSISPVLKVTTLNGLKSAIDSNARVVVDFSAPSWCVPCQRLAPHYAAAANAVEGVLFVEVDVDKSADISEAYNVQSVPTVMLFEDGEFVRNITGRTAVQLIKELRNG